VGWTHPSVVQGGWVGASIAQEMDSVSPTDGLGTAHGGHPLPLSPCRQMSKVLSPQVEIGKRCSFTMEMQFRKETRPGQSGEQEGHRILILPVPFFSLTLPGSVQTQVRSRCAGHHLDGGG
jgi:hypothetical protein